jgi:hypothetical protein
MNVAAILSLKAGYILILWKYYAQYFSLVINKNFLLLRIFKYISTLVGCNCCYLLEEATNSEQYYGIRPHCYTNLAISCCGFCHIFGFWHYFQSTCWKQLMSTAPKNARQMLFAALQVWVTSGFTPLDFYS